MNCLRCSAPFELTRPDRKYRSANCRGRASAARFASREYPNRISRVERRAKVMKMCARCGKSPLMGGNAKYCSITCRQAVANKNYRAKHSRDSERRGAIARAEIVADETEIVAALQLDRGGWLSWIGRKVHGHIVSRDACPRCSVATIAVSSGSFRCLLSGVCPLRTTQPSEEEMTQEARDFARLGGALRQAPHETVWGDGCRRCA
jgi:hypothetical protein